MPDEIKKYIDHIKLDNGEKYWLEDAEALKAEGGVITGDLEVQGTTILDDDVTITGDTIISGSASITGETSLSGDVLVVGDSALVGNVDIKEDATVEGNLSVEGNETLTGNFSVDGNTQLTGNVTTDGTTTANDDVSINGDLSVDGETTLTGDTYITGEVSVIGNSTLDGTLTVTNDVIASSDLSVGGNLGVNGASSFNDNVSVTGDVSITGDESITGALSVGGNAVITGNVEAANLAGGTTSQVLTKNSDDDFDFGWVTPITDYNDLTNKPQINDVTLQGNKSLHDLDIQREIKYVSLSDGQGTLTQEQHDTLFTVHGYACIVYSDGVSQSILERSGVRGSVFYWTATEINGNQLLTKQIGVDFTTDAWTYTVEEIEEKIDLIEIDTSTLPTTLSQQVYNTLFSSKLNKIVDIAQDDHHTRNRVYSYVDDIFDTTEQKTYTRFGCTYNDGNDVIRSIIIIDRSNRGCAVPINYILNEDNVVTVTDLNSSLSLEDVEKIKKGAILYVRNNNLYFTVEWIDSSSLSLHNTQFTGNLSYYRQVRYNTNTGARSSFSEKYLPWFGNLPSTNRILKTKNYSNEGSELTYAVVGTDYIAPGDNRLIKSGGTEGQVITKNSSTNYDYSWADLPKGIPDAGTTGQALVKNSNTDYDVKWGTIDTYTQVHCTDATNTPIDIKWNDGTSDVTGTMTASQAATNHGPKSVFLVPSSTAGTQASGEYERSLDGNDIVYLLDVENSTFIKTVTTQFDVEHTHTITPTITTLTAQASGTAVSNTQDAFVKSYPGQSSKMITTQITGTNGTQSVSKVTKTDGSAAVLTETITADGNAINGLQLGTLKFSWTANVPTTLTVTDYDVAKVASSSTTVATGSLDINAAGASVMTSLGNPVTANALTSSIISTQPTITLNNEPSIDVVTNVTETNSNRYIED